MTNNITDETQYDVVIIGSGVGGLSTGINIKKRAPDLKTLILEQHFEPGGYVSGFRRKGYYFDSGAEGSIDFGKGEPVYELFKELGFSHTFKRLDPMEVYQIGNKKITMYANLEKFTDELIRHFPDEKEGIIRFMNHCALFVNEVHELELNTKSLTFIKILKILFKYPNLRKYGFTVFDKFYSMYLKNEEIKKCFHIYFLWAGEGPETMSAAKAAYLIGSTSTNGPYYPEGGMLTFAQKLKEHYESLGGTIKLSMKAEKIVIENDCVKGVIVEDGTFIKAGCVVSNADLKYTVHSLAGDKYFPKSYVKKVNKLVQSVSGITVFLGIKKNLTGIPDHIIINPNVNSIRDVLDGKFNLSEIAVRIPTNVDSSLLHDGKTSLMLHSFAPYNYENRWRTGLNNERTEEYKNLKNELAHKMVEIAESVIPGLKKSIEVIHTSTPLTYKRYTNNIKGAWYAGIDALQKFSMKSPVKGLLFVGANVFGGGVGNCILSGKTVALHILKQTLCR